MTAESDFVPDYGLSSIYNLGNTNNYKKIYEARSLPGSFATAIELGPFGSGWSWLNNGNNNWLNSSM